LNLAEQKLGRDRSEIVQKLADVSGSKNFVPLPGSQVAFLACPIEECALLGERGPGKTLSLLMSWAQFVGQGFGAAWRGVIVRQSYPALGDIIEQSKDWFYPIFPGAKFHESASSLYWRMPGGEALLFRSFESEKMYYKFHGHQYTFLGHEEMTNWQTDVPFKILKSTLRSPEPGIPKFHRGTSNPSGPGHGWVKDRYDLAGCPKKGQLRTRVIDDAVDEDGELEPPRVAIFSRLKENLILLENDPDYPKNIRASAPNPAVADAWMNGSWDIVSGGMFSETFDRDVHIVKRFEPPNTWAIRRVYDYGWRHPFALAWIAESDGSDYKDADGKLRSTVRGDLFVVREWYGWSGKPNVGKPLVMTKVMKGIVEREMSWGWWGRVQPGPTDSQYFQMKDGNSLAKEAQKPIRLDDGKVVRLPAPFTRANQSGGTRKKKWALMNQRFENSKTPEGQFVREYPGLFIFDNCVQTLRTVPSLPISEKDPDDVPKDGVEDHLADCIAGDVLMAGRGGKSGRRRGG